MLCMHHLRILCVHNSIDVKIVETVAGGAGALRWQPVIELSLPALPQPAAEQSPAMAARCDLPRMLLPRMWASDIKMPARSPAHSPAQPTSPWLPGILVWNNAGCNSSRGPLLIWHSWGETRGHMYAQCFNLHNLGSGIYIFDFHFMAGCRQFPVSRISSRNLSPDRNNETPPGYNWNYNS